MLTKKLQVKKGAFGAYYNFALVFCIALVGIYIISCNYNIFGAEQSYNKESVGRNVKHYGSIKTNKKEHQIPQVVSIVYRHKNGKVLKGVLNKEEYSEFTQAQLNLLSNNYEKIKSGIYVKLKENLDDIFLGLNNRVPEFADWYYSYGTQYQILWEGLITGLVRFGEGNIKSIVSDNIEKIILSQYEYRVLKPELTDEKLEMLYEHLIKEVGMEWLKIIEILDDNLEFYISEKMGFMESSDEEYERQEIIIDWNAVKYKLYMKPDTNIELGGIRSLVLTTLAISTGKGVGIELSKQFLAFLSNRATLAYTGATMSALGGSVGGVAGMVIGGSVGLGFDWILHKSTEIVGRAQFEKNVIESIITTKNSVQHKALSSLYEIIELQYNDIIQSVLIYKS
jgi:hypothetical protein